MRLNLKPAALLAEFIGTALLLTVIVGSGIMAESLTQDAGLVLFINAVTIAAALGVLIFFAAPISGAHFNPAVTLVAVLRGQLSWLEGCAYAITSFIAAISGTALANIMFGLAPIQIAQRERSGVGLWVGEVVATAGLILIIRLLGQRGKPHLGPVVIPAWIFAAIIFTSSTAFANPAVTFGRGFSDTFTAINANSILPFIAAQVIGALLGLGIGKIISDITTPSVLFVCVHNAGKSQMAAALMRSLAGETVRVFSGGTKHGETLNAEAKAVIEEIGLTMSDEYPKAIDNSVFEKVDRIVILGDEATLDATPNMRGKIVTWHTPKPGGEFGGKLDQTRIIRDDIERRVRVLHNELTSR